MMTKFFIPLLILTTVLCDVALAQTPTANLMPDGSHDMYIGVGAVSRPRYEGSSDNRVSALPVLQVQWSNGIFIAGMSAGMHLSEQSDQEFGPLLTFDAGRNVNGTGHGVACPRCEANPGITGGVSKVSSNKLEGMDDINPRILLGGFYNFQLAKNLRLTNNVLYGAGNQHRGLRWNSDLRYSLDDFAPHHQVTISLGVSLTNQAYNQAYFGVTQAEFLRSLNRSYTASAGVKDIHAELHWNWELSSTWLLTSALNVSRLNGSAAASPLVEKATGVTLSSALAYRF